MPYLAFVIFIIHVMKPDIYNTCNVCKFYSCIGVRFVTIRVIIKKISVNFQASIGVMFLSITAVIMVMVINASVVIGVM